MYFTSDMHSKPLNKYNSIPFSVGDDAHIILKDPFTDKIIVQSVKVSRLEGINPVVRIRLDSGKTENMVFSRKYVFHTKKEAEQAIRVDK